MAHSFGTALPMLRTEPVARLRLSVGIACAAGLLAGCSGTVQSDSECIYIPTGEHFTLKAGTSVFLGNGTYAVDVTGSDGFTRSITSANAEHWKCRAASVGRNAKRQDAAERLGPQDEHAVGAAETPNPSSSSQDPS